MEQRSEFARVSSLVMVNTSVNRRWEAREASLESASFVERLLKTLPYLFPWKNPAYLTSWTTANRIIGIFDFRYA